MKTKLFFATLIFFSSYAIGQPIDQAALKTKCFTLYRFLEKNHYQPVEWNDSASAKLFTKFIDELDDDKLLFTAADLKMLEPFRYTLDDEVTGKSWNFLKTIMPLFKVRTKQFDSTALNSLSKPFDYLKTESLVWPAAGFAATPAELQIRVQQYFKWQLMGSMADSIGDKAIAKTVTPGLPNGFAAVESFYRQKIKKRALMGAKMSVDNKDFDNSLAEAFFNDVCWMYDPHTDFMNFAENEEFQSAVTAAEYTAGINVSKNDKDQWTIKYLVPGGPAWRSGDLHAGDVIVNIISAGNEITDLDELSESEIEELLQGTATDKLSLTVKNSAGTQKTVSLVKEKISSDEDIVRSYLLNGQRRMGYIQLPGFYSRFENDPTAKGCATDVAKEIIKLKRDTIAGLILDLRNNGGGSVQEALELAGIFINEGPLCLFKERSGKVSTLKDPNRGTIYDGPLIILTNGASASASELTAAVLQDYNRALIVGGNTYGKGTAQIVMPLDTSISMKEAPTQTSGDFVKVTEEKFYRVNGSTVQWKGVVPDIALPDVYQQEKIKERSQQSALKPDSCRKAYFNALPALPIAGLAAKSSARVGASNYFKTINKYVAWSAIADNRRTIPLKWEAYAAYFKERSAMYKEQEDVVVPPTVFFKADNNGIDKDRENILSPQSKTLNESWLKKLQQDLFLEEACKIMQDWLDTKK